VCVTDFQCYGVGLGDTNPRPVGSILRFDRLQRTRPYVFFIHRSLPPDREIIIAAAHLDNRFILLQQSQRCLVKLDFIVQWSRLRFKAFSCNSSVARCDVATCHCTISIHSSGNSGRNHCNYHDDVVHQMAPKDCIC